LKVKRVFKTKLPLLNGGKPQYTLKNLWKLVGDNVTKITKPKYRTGGGAMGDRVDLRINMRLCAACVRKYRGWYKGTGYRPCWETRWMGDCNACGLDPCWVFRFLPEEAFHRLLDSRFFGDAPKP
jgi:hypothetical protein